ncbi:MAG TPA: restriction endonuclease [Clostridia bacterium]|jgi:type II restriction enzyme|nr:restriction endonuclease [Clostridia bacterium]
MKMIDKYKEFGVFSEKAAFEYLLANLKDTIRTYDFFVAWEKIFGNVLKVEVALNILNTLIGKDDLENKLKELIRSYPEIVPVIPLLIAVRETSIKVADMGSDVEYSFAERKRYDDDEIDRIVYFASKCGILNILADKSIKNLVDYYLGVEVGLDTNARKNRSGKAMENLIEVYVKTICDKHGYNYIAQASVTAIKAEWGRDVPTDKSQRCFDFAIKAGENIYLLEVNYYSGGGTKLKSVAGEFKSLFELVKQEPKVGFIWVTDGPGWLTAQHPLLETFNATDYVINIKMIENGLLEEIITKGL